jgi:lipopolysaccharide/colanic/teichoic acid biosynthesis glycosyltransferase
MTPVTRTLGQFRRLVDLLSATVALILAAPIMMVVAIAIRVDSPGPVIFHQTRVGWRNNLFTIYKFRTMRAHSERLPQWAQVNDSRVTRLGRWLRLTHLDELPQLVNVLLGNMSFVGPRPERPEFVEQLRREIPFYDLRHSVVPGITGWAQVNYQYCGSIEESRRKLEYDLYYVLHASPLLDFLILFKTMQVMLFMRGSR